MQLHYYRDPNGNFGDDLNRVVWPEVAPGLLDDDEREVLLGIGTLLNTRFDATLPAAALRHVAGTGYGYGDPVTVDGRWRIHFVRGPRTAAALRLSPTKAITDPAILVASMRLPAPAPGRRIAFMPHHRSAANTPWGLLCSALGVRFVDPRWDTTRTLAALRGCDLVACEAMHGAIVADALRIPWIAAFMHEQVNAAKWMDWSESLGIDLQPQVWDPPLPVRGRWRVRRSRPRLAFALWRIRRALAGEGQLSSESRHTSSLERVHAAVRSIRPASRQA